MDVEVMEFAMDPTDSFEVGENQGRHQSQQNQHDHDRAGGSPG
jgi:hypothetical protein